jgi:hypothetical protein
MTVNPLNAELNPICYLLALLGAHHFLNVSRVRVNILRFCKLNSTEYAISIQAVFFSNSYANSSHYAAINRL